MHAKQLITSTLLPSILLLACAATATAAQEAPHVAIVQEWKGFNAAQEKPKKLVVKDQKAWKDAWATMKGNIQPKPEPPKVDFGKHEVIVVFMGRKMTGGYAVKIVRVYDNDKRIVTVKETSPRPDGMVTMVVTLALTSPYHAVVVPKTTKAVEFAKN